MAEVIPIRPGLPTPKPTPARRPQKQPGHVHDFDPVSGWCSRCTYRNDGRLTNAGGTVYRPGTAEQKENETNETD